MNLYIYIDLRDCSNEINKLFSLAILKIYLKITLNSCLDITDFDN